MTEWMNKWMNGKGLRKANTTAHHSEWWNESIIMEIKKEWINEWNNICAKFQVSKSTGKSLVALLCLYSNRMKAFSRGSDKVVDISSFSFKSDIFFVMLRTSIWYWMGKRKKSVQMREYANTHDLCVPYCQISQCQCPVLSNPDLL